MKYLLTNGLIYTAQNDMTWAEMLAINGELIEYVGKQDDEVFNNYTEKGYKAYDCKGKMLIPGIVDGHVHPGMVAKSEWHINMPWTEDVDEWLTNIKEFVNKHPKEEVPFLFFQYYPTSMFGTEGPNKELLDEVVSDRPCHCQDFGGHLHWVNSKMLELMEVDESTPDPVPGLEMFVRDENGKPTGWVKEFAWLHFQENLWKNLKWRPPVDITEESLLPYMEFNVAHGITAISEGFLESEKQIESMYSLDKKGKMHFYYDGNIRFEGIADLPEKIELSKAHNKKYGGKHIKFNTVKLFLDGTNESGNSAVIDAHINNPAYHGEIKMQEDELVECLLLCNKENHDMQIHMVGDRAFRVACNAVEKAKKITKEQWVMQIIFLHCEMIHESDMKRPAELEITVNWSPHWAGGYFGEEAINFVGKERWDNMYQFNPIIDSGALFTCSSDVVSLYELEHRAHPFMGMQVSHTRIDPEKTLPMNKFKNGMRPKEEAKLSREVLLKAYTISAAKQLHWDKIMGSLEVGKLANIGILSENYFEVEEDKIKDIEFDAVIFEGLIVKGAL